MATPTTNDTAHAVTAVLFSIAALLGATCELAKLVQASARRRARAAKTSPPQRPGRELRKCPRHVGTRECTPAASRGSAVAGSTQKACALQRLMSSAQRVCAPRPATSMLGAAARRCAPALRPAALLCRAAGVPAQPRVFPATADAVRSTAAAHGRLISRFGHAASAAAQPHRVVSTANAPTTSDDALRLYNTLTRQKEVFTPREDQVRARVVRSLCLAASHAASSRATRCPCTSAASPCTTTGARGRGAPVAAAQATDSLSWRRRFCRAATSGTRASTWRLTRCCAPCADEATTSRACPPRRGAARGAPSRPRSPPAPLTPNAPHTPCRSYVRNFTDVDDKIIRRAAEARAPAGFVCFARVRRG